MKFSLPAVAASLLAAAMAVITAVISSGFGYFDRTQPYNFVITTIILWVLFGLAMLTLRRVAVKPALGIILIGSVLIGGAALTGPPNTSSDSARYAWDGIVQDAGISPYRYVPANDALTSLRPSWLFSDTVVNADGSNSCADPRMNPTKSVPSGEPFCTVINRPTVPTIYPAAAEMFFAGIRLFVGAEAQYWPLQLTGLLISLGVTGMLMLGMRRRGLDPRLSAYWAWCPMVAAEAINNAHIDALGAILVVSATLLVSRGMRFRGGIALGAAIAVKLVPAIAAPALLRRQGWKVVVASVATFAVLYIPYVFASGLAVIGFLPGYLTEEGYSDGGRFTLLSIFLPPAAAIPVALVLLLATAILVWIKTNPAHPWLGQLIMIGVTLLIASPRYPWYALLLIPFIALSGRWEWFVVPLALTYRQFLPSHLGYQIALAIAVVVIVAMATHRTGPEGRARLRHPLTMLRSRQPSPSATRQS